MPEIFPIIKIGTSVVFDDGRITSEVVAKGTDGLELEVQQARARGEKFKNQMGINFPELQLKIDPLTVKDLTDLDFICRHADLVGYSFVQEPEHIDRLVTEINGRNALRGHLPALGLIAKIETKRAVRNLPEIIVRGAGNGPFGVMIARGDLAVELGYLRIAEIQEETLWLCEAAHVPVIWATQVLERLAKKGVPSRAEMTDAAMSERAECVMLNKGPFIFEAISALNGVLIKMQAHQRKKMATFRALRSWKHLFHAHHRDNQEL